MAGIRTPHFRVPFNVVGGRVDVVEQDSEEDIRQCVISALSTPLGSLIDLPEFGVPHDAFKQQTPAPSADAYLTAVERCEPRARLVGDVTFEELVEHVVLSPARGATDE
jgi:phage baseplate assembly protein W